MSQAVVTCPKGIHSKGTQRHPRSKSARCLLALLLSCWFLLSTPLVVQAQDQGYSPQTGLTLGPDGSFYGTTVYGGRDDDGTIFKITPQGVLTSLYSFSLTFDYANGAPINSDGAWPNVSLRFGSDGTLYGTTSGGGEFGEGTVFKITTSGALTTLYTFGTQQNDGGFPSSALTLGSDGNLYGIAGLARNMVYRVTSAGQLTAVTTFTTAVNVSTLTLAGDVNLYGTTVAVGSVGNGTVFRLTPEGHVTTVCSFSGGADGGGASGLTLGRDGDLYGSMSKGGPHGVGTVFKVSLQGQLTTLYAFNRTDGVGPNGLTLGQNGNFYATTTGGGANGWGTWFTITPTGKLTVLTSLSYSQSGAMNPGLTQGGDGNFYGTTYHGGQRGRGTIFKATPTGKFTTIYSFVAGGATPTSLVLGQDGNFYGTTVVGGTNDDGTIYRVTPAGDVAVIYSFHALSATHTNADGAWPTTALTESADGSFYGMTSGGGKYGAGTIFKVTSAGKLTVVYSPSTSMDLAIGLTFGNPRLVIGKDGSLYGATLFGGANNLGSVFKLTARGNFTTLYSFSGTDGSWPTDLLVGGDNNLYGTTQTGGANGNGTVFRITLEGKLTSLHPFSALSGNGDNVDGAYPLATLTQTSDGNFYGTTTKGGQNGNGTIFKITPQGEITTVHSMGSPSGEGSQLSAPLIQGPDGSLYGTARSGGQSDGGVVFRVTSQGQFRILWNFGNGWLGGSVGQAPNGLTLGPNGNLYGTVMDSEGGADLDAGLVYQITPAGSTTGLYVFH